MKPVGGASAFEDVLVDVVRERAKNIVQARNGWGAAADLDHLDGARAIAEAKRMMETGERPAKRGVADWRDGLRQAMQVITSSAENVRKALATSPPAHDIVNDSVAALVRNIDRLDRSLAIVDAAYPTLQAAIDFDDDIQRLAEEVREQCRVAAVVAPLHNERAEDVVGRVDLAPIIKRVRGDESC